uniref:Uncharacterized protein n=1 Tax=Meloidogyne enterolobii TaxID=390850 RepID=A0A6V7UQE0_MELEN|nr:unnamed protein product [Meloidogyne enterolobii]
MSSTTFICIICSKALTSNNMYSTSCGHVFHSDCITKFIFQKKYCPKCWNVLNLNDIKQIFLEEKSSGCSGNVQIKTESNIMKLYVKDTSGGTTVLEKVKFSDTLEVIKCMVEMKLGIPTFEQRLIFAGKQLEDGRTMADYNIKDGSTMHLVKRLVGC